MSEEIEFPKPVCTDEKPHAKHLPAGTWRTECPGIKPPDTSGGERTKCVHGFWIQGGIQTCSNGCTRTLADELEQWIAEQVAQLSESELLMLKGVLDDMDAGRPVEHFTRGTKVYVDSWGAMVFTVQGTVPWHQNGVVSRKVEIRSATGNISGHVDPRELRRVRADVG